MSTDQPHDPERLAFLKNRIGENHRKGKAAAREVIERALAVGDDLVEIQECHVHGDWTGWVEENCSFDIRTAQRYMGVARNRERVEDLFDSADSLTLNSCASPWGCRMSARR